MDAGLTGLRRSQRARRPAAADPGGRPVRLWWPQRGHWEKATLSEAARRKGSTAWSKAVFEDGSVEFVDVHDPRLKIRYERAARKAGQHEAQPADQGGTKSGKGVARAKGKKRKPTPQVAAASPPTTPVKRARTARRRLDERAPVPPGDGASGGALEGLVGEGRSLDDVFRNLEQTMAASSSAAPFTSSLAFAVPSESPRTPHTSIRPTRLEARGGDLVAECSARLAAEATATAVLPLKALNPRAFILQAGRRAEARLAMRRVTEAAAHLMESGGHDAMFFMFRYDAARLLVPVLDAVEESDVQVVLQSKRTQAGTAALRLLAKRFTRASQYPTCSIGLQLDLYVSQDLWPSLSVSVRGQLLGVLHNVERALREGVARKNAHRLQSYYADVRARVGLRAIEDLLSDDMEPSARAGQAVGAPGCRGADAALAQLVCLVAHNSLPKQQGTFPWPFHLIATRDAFAHQLIGLSKEDKCGVVSTQYFFDAANAPAEYGMGDLPEDQAFFGLLPVGVTVHSSVFPEAALRGFESEVDNLVHASENELAPSHIHATRGRTKFFFGARYLWTEEQLASPSAREAAGVRTDVPLPPRWVHEGVKTALVGRGVCPADFADRLNSCALNVYHDGSEGIQSHLDPPERFARPILSLSLFSDSRLSFGTRLLGAVDGMFSVPMRRGDVTVLERDSFAADRVNHAIRAVDISEKRAAVILRQINPGPLAAARGLLVDDTAQWLDDAWRLDEAPSHRALTRRREQHQALVQHCGGVLSGVIAGLVRDEQEEKRVERKCGQCLNRIIVGLEAEEQEEKRVERKCGQCLNRIIVGLEAEEHRDERALLTAGRVVREMVWKVARAEARRQRDEALVPKVINGVIRRLVLGVARGAQQAGGSTGARKRKRESTAALYQPKVQDGLDFVGTKNISGVLRRLVGRTVFEHETVPKAVNAVLRRVVRGVERQSQPAGRKPAAGPRGALAVGWRVGVWWALDRRFYHGLVHSYDAVGDLHQVNYLDGDVERINLTRETVVWLRGPAQSS